jgi:oligoribonuclease (3'-5' exoribonuclease)
MKDKELCKVQYEPFTSIDIECTGLNPDTCSILEVGAAFYDGIHKEPVNELEFICIPNGYELLDLDYMLHGQPIALSMNKNILDEITETQRETLKKHPEWKINFPEDKVLMSSRNVAIMSEADGMNYLYDWMDFIQTTYKLKKKHILAGKNLNELDVPFLKTKMGKERWDKIVGFRKLDLTSMFAAFSRKTSPLKDINALRGLGTVSHRALQDARETGAAIIDIYEKNLQW